MTASFGQAYGGAMQNQPRQAISPLGAVGAAPGAGFKAMGAPASPQAPNPLAGVDPKAIAAAMKKMFAKPDAVPYPSPNAPLPPAAQNDPTNATTIGAAGTAPSPMGMPDSAIGNPGAMPPQTNALGAGPNATPGSGDPSWLQRQLQGLGLMGAGGVQPNLPTSGGPGAY